jgi:hypothetical protein
MVWKLAGEAEASILTLWFWQSGSVVVAVPSDFLGVP